jgi:hypothetical protein
MILVFSKEQHGGPIINGIPIPGYLDPVPPARISIKFYFTNKSLFNVAPYTPERLKAMFGGNPPDIHFTYRDVHSRVPYSYLVDLCRYFGITSSKIKSDRDRRAAIRKFLRENG